MTRRESREHIFKMLFCRDFYEMDEWKEQAQMYVDALQPVEGQLTEEDQAAEGWKTKRMGKVDVTVLRLALYEMEYDDQVPTKVAINEAVEIAKKFGGDESPSFVNGVLARLVD